MNAHETTTPERGADRDNTLANKVSAGFSEQAYGQFWSAPRVLDPACGSRMMWFDRSNPDVVFGDCRSETVTVVDRSHSVDGRRVLRIKPDVQMDFRAIPYPDNTFPLVAFDPPHLKRAGDKSWLRAKYGALSDNWRDDLRKGFAECFRVLAPNGTLIFKWNETQVPLRDVLALTDIAPLFGQRSGRAGMTHWLVFIKPAQGVML